MKYKKFTIKNYRAIEGPLEIDVHKNSLIPIIGVNECGKTTILHALLTFDHFNDDLNRSGRHLQDVENLYTAAPKVPEIAAEIEITKEEIKKLLRSLSKNNENLSTAVLRRYQNVRAPLEDSIWIKRNLKTREYSLEGIKSFNNPKVNHALSNEIISKLPFILYFDDFQDSIPERIEIHDDESDESDWLAILDTLFSKTDSNYSVYNLASKEVRQRKTIISKVERKLNKTLIDEWRNFRLDDSNALEISIEYEEEEHGDSVRSYLKFDIVETDASGDKHYFFVRDRSKGFYWFFNFVMKLEFNPKVVETDGVEALYVLDEPGSYLHYLAQERLCIKLRQLSQNNHVIYCTHSHHLLNPEVIPLNLVRIAEKDGHGRISLVSIYEHQGTITDNRAAYQPLLDALQVRPFAVDIAQDMVVIVEGMMDYYLLELFKRDSKFRVLPSVGADSMKFYISVMIAWRVPYRALWDNDDRGRAALEDAIGDFGTEVSAGRFFLIPLPGNRSRKRVIQDLIDGNDVKSIRSQLELPANTGIHKTIASLFYSPDRLNILSSLSDKTRQNFDLLIKKLGV